jgi:hypothetical protein
MADGDEFILGQFGNIASSPTGLVGKVDGSAVLWVEQQSETNAGEAIVALGGPGRTAIFGFGGNSTSGRGGLGIAGQGGNGIPHELGGVGMLGSGGGPSDNRGDGVWGVTRSPNQAGVFGFNFGLGPGVRGYSAAPGTGGQRPQPVGNGIGVEGKSGGGTGVYGAASVNQGIGIRAEHTGGGRALAVKGRAGFSTCGSATIAAGQASKTVSHPAVTTESRVTITLTAHPGGSAQVHWVARQAGSFTVHLTQAVASVTSFTYLVVEPFTG